VNERINNIISSFSAPNGESTHILQRRSGGMVRLTGVGLLVFTVLIFVLLFRVLGPDEHPLALQRDVLLCEALGAEVWQALGAAASAGLPGLATGNPDGRSVCELHPVPPAGQPLARVMLTTEADLRYRNLGQSLGRHINTFVAELKASGWEVLEVQGPWRRTHAFTGPGSETVLLIEDQGVFLWISSTDVPLERLLTFAQAVTEQLRSTG
jgi:anti-sigma factor RsiW